MGRVRWIPRGASAWFRNGGPFWIGFAVVLVARVLMAMSRSDEFRGEEIYIGSFAWALREGMPLDPAQLPVIVHLRGSVFFGLLALPLTLVFGPSLVVLRTVAVLWGAAAGGCFTAILGRVEGRRAALVGAFVYALLPPAFQMLDVLAMGSHVDTLLPILASLAVFVGGGSPLGWRRAGVLGLVTGFGLLFSYQHAVVVIALLLTWLARDPWFWRRWDAAAFLVGAGALAAPIPFLSRSTTLVNKSMGDHLLPEGVAGVLPKFARTAGEDLRLSWLFEENGGAWAGWLFLAASVLALVALVPRLLRREPLAVFCFLYPLGVLGAHAISDFELNLLVTKNGIGSRYLLPALPFVAAWSILAAEGRRRISRASGLVLPACLIVAGAAGYVALLDVGTPWRRPPIRCTNLANFAMHVDYAGGPRALDRLDWVERVEPDWAHYRPLTFENIHPPAELLPRPGQPPNAEHLRTVRALDPRLQPFAFARVGAEVGRGRDRALVERAAMMPVPDAAGRPWFLRGLGTGVTMVGLEELIVTRGRATSLFERLEGMPPGARVQVAEGAGFRLGFLFTPYYDLTVALVPRAARELGEDLWEPFYRGLGLGYRLRFREASYAPPKPLGTDMERAVPAEQRASFRRGLAAPSDGFGSP